MLPKYLKCRYPKVWELKFLIVNPICQPWNLKGGFLQAEYPKHVRPRGHIFFSGCRIPSVSLGTFKSRLLFPHLKILCICIIISQMDIVVLIKTLSFIWILLSPSFWRLCTYKWYAASISKLKRDPAYIQVKQDQLPIITALSQVFFDKDKTAPS